MTWVNLVQPIAPDQNPDGLVAVIMEEDGTPLDQRNISIDNLSLIDQAATVSAVCHSIDSSVITALFDGDCGSLMLVMKAHTIVNMTDTTAIAERRLSMGRCPRHGSKVFNEAGIPVDCVNCNSDE